MRSFARARSSSRRAPPKQASKPCSAIASSSVTVCSRLREARGPVSSVTRPASIDACTLATSSCRPPSATSRSRNASTSGKLWPVSTCSSGNGTRPGANAFWASRTSTIESLPPENSSAGRSRSAATSRSTWMASASSARRCESVGEEIAVTGRSSPAADPSDVQPALRLGQAGPAALPPGARRGAGGAADRRVALVVQRVVGQVALEDAPPQVLLGPLDERVVLPDAAALVVLDGLRVRPGGGLLAADAGDPGIGAGQRALQRGHLGVPAAGARAPRAGRVLDPHVDAEALLEGAPGRQRLREQHAGVDRDDARVGGEADELVDEDGLLLLERAQHHQPRVMALDRLAEHLRGGHAGSSTGSSSCVHQAGSVRPANARKSSPSAWCCSYRPKIRSSVSLSSQCGTFLTTTSPKRGSGPSRPPMRMSMASTNSPSTFLSTPSMPTSAIWCWAQLEEQPAKCTRRSSPWPFGRTCSSRNLPISTARSFVWTLARPQNSLPVHVCRPRANSVGKGERSSCSSGSFSSASSFSSGIHGSSTFCWWVRRSASSGLSPYSRASRTSSNSCSAFRRPTGTTAPTV